MFLLYRFLLVEKNKEEKAREVLMKLRGPEYDPTEELDAMSKEYEEEQKLEKTSSLFTLYFTYLFIIVFVPKLNFILYLL